MGSEMCIRDSYRDEDGIARCDKRDAKGSYIAAPKKSNSTGAKPNL